MEKLLLKPNEVAEALGIGRSTAYDLLRSGALPSIRLGGQLRVPTEALRAWVHKNIPEPQGAAPV